MSRLILKSPAKLNLYLDVLSKRQDGYHNILTLFERIDLCDEIELNFKDNARLQLFCSNKSISRNLALKAAQLLRKRYKVSKGARIRIKKLIPLASGLGGGSSNAASVLIGLNRLWGLNLPKTALLDLGKELGMDVPFFLSQSSFALGISRGEKISAVKGIRKLWHILIVPKIRCLTSRIYEKLDSQKKSALKNPKKGPGFNILIQALRQKDLKILGRNIYNSLESIVTKQIKPLRDIKRRLRLLGIEAMGISGTGPAIFGIVNTRKEAQELCRKLQQRDKWQVFITRTL